ncbi:unnamed protein product [Prorocentrum cordatum]|uniref:Subtilisin n=1 Tax=Prorocentrum cordatum TaxID=2364126 RepID=A0ABN9XH56_9DINO|nr:unnamed protein product [Polarella glacialis]
MTQKAPARACLLIPLLAHGVFGTTAAAEVDLQEDTVLLQLGTDAASFDLARVSSLKGVSTVTSTVLPVNTSQQTGRRQVEAADHMVKGAFWNQVGQDIDGEASGDRSGEVVSLSSDGSRVAIGARYNDGATELDSGHVRVFVLSGNTWSQLGQDIDGEASGDYSGVVSLSSDGSRVAIGAATNDGAGLNFGHVRVFGLSGNTWSQLGQDIDGEAFDDNSGFSVSLSSDGSRVAIGAIFNDGAGSNSGHVRVFGLSGNTWSQLGQDIDGEASGDVSGVSVSLSSEGSRVAIGATRNDGATGFDSGHVRVFGRSEWRFGVAEQRRQPRGHWSFLQRRCWVGFWSRSRLRVFANAGTYAGAFASADGRTIGFANASTDARADVGTDLSCSRGSPPDKYARGAF